MEFNDVMALLSGFAHQPYLVYGVVIAMLTASSFGLPIPEEVTLISAGLISYVAVSESSIQAEFATPLVDPLAMAVVCFVAVFMSDFLVFAIGRKLRGRAPGHSRLGRLMASDSVAKVTRWTERYGAIMAGVFRFTPGLRFPGHMACGALGLPTWKFVLVDGTAALISVPTQVLLIAYYGRDILRMLQNAKTVLLVTILVGCVGYFGRHLFTKSFREPAAESPSATIKEDGLSRRRPKRFKDKTG